MRISDFPMIDEVKQEYIELRQNGHGRAAAVERLMQNYSDELTHGAEDDGLLFWIGLADAQYALNELSAEVGKSGSDALEKLKAWEPAVTPGDIERRKERYKNAPMPEKKTVKKPKRFRTEWKNGDTFAYRLRSDEAKELGIEGKHILFRVVDSFEFGDGRLLPVLTLTFWSEDILPTNSEEFQRAPLMQLDKGRFELPYHLSEYRTELIIRSSRQLASLPLIYLGNFSGVKMPDNEAIFTHPGEVSMLPAELLEQRCLIYWKAHCYYTKNNQSYTSK